MSDLFESGFSSGWNATGEGFNGEYVGPRATARWDTLWPEMVADARAHAWPVCLAANLATAAGLCAAWRDGAAWGEWFGDPCTSLLDRPWSPGCNRPAPGVG
jgi:hypothetical protein